MARGGGPRRPGGGALSRTFLWAYHRSISHAFARSILEISSARVLHETYLAAVVFGQQRDEAVYRSFGPVRECSSFEAIRDRLMRWDGEEGVRPDQRPGVVQRIASLAIRHWSLSAGRCCSDPSHCEPRDPTEVGTDRRHLFVKCSPFYQMGQDLRSTLPPLTEPDSMTASSRPPLFQHTFLIRRPDKVALSMYNLENGSGSGNTQALLEADIVETHRLYRFVLDKSDDGLSLPSKSTVGSPPATPLIVDADDLLCNPAAVLQGYCSRVGLPYEDSILKWDPGPVLEWLPHGSAAAGEWDRGPFANVFRSTGFIAPSDHGCGNRSTEQTVEQNMDRLPKAIRAVVERRWHLYQEMHDARYQS